jgi:hypothetical protein
MLGSELTSGSKTLLEVKNVKSHSMDDRFIYIQYNSKLLGVQYLGWVLNGPVIFFNFLNVQQKTEYNSLHFTKSGRETVVILSLELEKPRNRQNFDRFFTLRSVKNLSKICRFLGFFKL